MISLQRSQLSQELAWYTHHIIREELPQISETLQMCGNLLVYNSPQEPNEKEHIERGPPIKLPVSSPKSEALKGILVRDGMYVTELSVRIKDPHFKMCHLTISQPIVLDQIADAKTAIDHAKAICEYMNKENRERENRERENTERMNEETDSTENSENTRTNSEYSRTETSEKRTENSEKRTESSEKRTESSETSDPENTNNLMVTDYSNGKNGSANRKSDSNYSNGKNGSDWNNDSFLSHFKNLLEQIQIAKNSIQLATDPALVFPQHESIDTHFDPPLHKTAVDVYINRAEICVDLKHLHTITESPWGQMDSSGVSYIDRIRDEMKLPPSSRGSAVSGNNATPLNVVDIEHRLNELVSPSTPDLFSSVMSHLTRPKLSPIDYVTKCVTHKGSVVMVDAKLEVSSPDPVLVSVYTKLDSMEYLVGGILENLVCLA